LFLGTLVTIIYVLANLALAFTMQGTPNAADIANNGIMFASNDSRGAAAASMIMGNVGVL
jgi:APA family basic amino acid/polyamine antiporter